MWKKKETESGVEIIISEEERKYNKICTLLGEDDKEFWTVVYGMTLEKIRKIYNEFAMPLGILFEGFYFLCVLIGFISKASFLINLAEKMRVIQPYALGVVLFGIILNAVCFVLGLLLHIIYNTAFLLSIISLVTFLVLNNTGNEHYAQYFALIAAGLFVFSIIQKICLCLHHKIHEMKNKHKFNKIKRENRKKEKAAMSAVNKNSAAYKMAMLEAQENAERNNSSI